MLGKLMKQEFRSVGRLMLPLMLAALLLAGFVALGEYLCGYYTAVWLRSFRSVSEWLCGLTLVGLLVIAMVLIVARFYKNFLTDEGYLTFTLPVSVHSLLWAKLLTAAVLLLATALVTVASLLIVLTDGLFWRDLYEHRELALEALVTVFGRSWWLLIPEAFVVFVLAVWRACLQFYAAMSVGQAFPRHKLLWSIVFYFLFNLVLRIAELSSLISGLLGRLLEILSQGLNPFSIPENIGTVIHGLFLGFGAFCLVLCLFFYLVSWFFLRYKRNLQ